MDPSLRVPLVTRSGDEPVTARESPTDVDTEAGGAIRDDDASGSTARPSTDQPNSNPQHHEVADMESESSKWGAWTNFTGTSGSFLVVFTAAGVVHVSDLAWSFFHEKDQTLWLRDATELVTNIFSLCIIWDGLGFLSGKAFQTMKAMGSRQQPQPSRRVRFLARFASGFLLTVMTARMSSGIPSPSTLEMMENIVTFKPFRLADADYAWEYSLNALGLLGRVCFYWFLLAMANQGAWQMCELCHDSIEHRKEESATKLSELGEPRENVEVIKKEMKEDQQILESIKRFMSPSNAGRFFVCVMGIGSFPMTVSAANAALHPLDWHTAMYTGEVIVD